MDDLCCNDPDAMFCGIIKRDTGYIKTNTDEVETMCQVMEELLDKGRTEGIAEGTEKTLSGLADEMKAAGMTEEMIKMIITSYQTKAGFN